MIPLRYHNGNQFLHRKSADYRSRVKRKMRAYMPSSRLALSPRDCSSISPSPLPSSFGTHSGPGSNHSSRHPAIGVCRCKRPATDTSRFSPGSRKKRFSHEIHHRAPRHTKYADFSLGLLKQKMELLRSTEPAEKLPALDIRKREPVCPRRRRVQNVLPRGAYHLTNLGSRLCSRFDDRGIPRAVRLAQNAKLEDHPILQAEFCRGINSPQALPFPNLAPGGKLLDHAIEDSA